MKYTDWYFARAKEFQDRRGAIMEAYEKRMESLKNHKGSKYYEEEAAKAQKARDAALDPLKKEYTKLFNEILDLMKEANGSRKMTPPTEEELRTIQMIKLKDNPTYEELKEAAQTVKGNPFCLSTLSEISKRLGYRQGFGHMGEMTLPPETVAGLINSLAICTHDFLEHDTSRAARIAVKRYEQGQWGYNDPSPLPKRTRFDSKEECFRELARMDSDGLKLFSAVVDGAEGEA